MRAIGNGAWRRTKRRGKEVKKRGWKRGRDRLADILMGRLKPLRRFAEGEGLEQRGCKRSKARREDGR